MFYRDFYFAILSSGETGIRTPGTSQYNGFQDRRNRPLCHLSKNFSFKKCFSLKAMQKYYSFLISQIFQHKNIISTIFYNRSAVDAALCLK